MANRKKIKKAGSATRNIHKIATTFGVIPLVAMSSFLFNDSYSLASSVTPATARVTHGKTVYVGERVTFNLSDYFESLSTSLISSMNNNANSILTVNLSCHTIQGLNPGSATITIAVPDGLGSGGNVMNTFTVGVIEPALVIKALDVGGNGLDISDVVSAVSNSNPAANVNGDTTVDNYDYPALLDLIQLQTNLNPSYPKTPNVLIADQVLTTNTSPLEIDLNQYFSDLDGDYINYRVYSSETSVITSIYPGCSWLSLNPYSIGSSTITIVADDQKGGYEVASFLAEVVTNSPPEASSSPLYDLIMQPGTQWSTDFDGLFTDPDGDSLLYNATGGSVTSTVNKFYINGSSPAFDVEVIANDSHGGTSSPRTVHVDYIYPTNLVTGSYQLYHIESYFNSVLTSANAFTITSTSNIGTEAVQDLGCGHFNLNITGNQSGTYTITVKGENVNHDIAYRTFVISI
jgi:hypothetical protein